MSKKKFFYDGCAVVAISPEYHQLRPEWYPTVGTIGTVTEGGINSCFVQWPEGSTHPDDHWWIPAQYLMRLEDDPASPFEAPALTDIDEFFS